MTNQIEPIEVGYTDEDKVIFHLRRISLGESDELDAKLTDSQDAADKYKKQHELWLEALADYSVEMPEKYIKEKGELKRIPLGEDGNIAAALNARLSERSIENQWIVRDAFIRFKQSLQPTSRFLSFFE